MKITDTRLKRYHLFAQFLARKENKSLLVDILLRHTEMSNTLVKIREVAVGEIDRDDHYNRITLHCLRAGIETAARGGMKITRATSLVERQEPPPIKE